MIKNIVKIIVRLVVRWILSFVQLFFKQHKKRIVFFHIAGNIADNKKSFSDFLLIEKQWDVYWLYHHKNDLVFDPLYQDRVLCIYSLKGIKIALEASYYIVSHGLNEIGVFPFFKKKIINLWHGIPIKSLGLFSKEIQNNLALKQRLKRDSKHYHLWICASFIEQHYLSSAFNISPNKVIVTGLPRSDVLIKKKNNAKGEAKKKILYAPTYRDGEHCVFFPFKKMSYEALNQLLISHNAELIIRPHPSDIVSGKILREMELLYSGIKVADFERDSSLSDILVTVSGLVTDYSSVFMDALLLDIPCVFLPYDIHDYQKNVGLAYDYDFITPGPKPETFDEFMTCLSNLLTGDDGYRVRRKFVRNLFHQFKDSNACSRIFKFLDT